VAPTLMPVIETASPLSGVALVKLSLAGADWAWSCNPASGQSQKPKVMTPHKCTQRSVPRRDVFWNGTVTPGRKSAAGNGLSSYCCALPLQPESLSREPPAHDEPGNRRRGPHVRRLRDSPT